MAEPSGARPRVVFLCIGNACRSPMGEGWLRHMAGERFDVSSGGVHPIGVQPLTVKVMKEAGVDISDLRSSYVQHELDPPPDVLIALSASALDSLGSAPASTHVLNWAIPDPFGVRGDEATVLRAYRAARDEIEERIEDWLADGAPPLALDR